MTATAPTFCRFCGASIPKRTGEGTCRFCDPQGVIDHLQALCADVMPPAADDLATSRATCADYKEAYEDSKRLARELDVALHGETGAAPQASLCDLIGPAQKLRATCAQLQEEVNDWRQHLGDGPPSYHAAGIDMLKGDLEAWTHRAETTETERDTLRDMAFRLEAQVATLTAERDDLLFRANNAEQEFRQADAEKAPLTAALRLIDVNWRGFTEALDANLYAGGGIHPLMGTASYRQILDEQLAAVLRAAPEGAP